MEILRVEEALITLAASHLQRNDTHHNGREPGKALYIRLDISASHHTDEDSFTSGCGSHHMIFQRSGCWMRVFAASTSTVSERELPKLVEKFVMTSNHDSCWRNDGFSQLSQFLTAQEQLLDVDLARGGCDSIPPRKMSWDVFIDRMDWVEITWFGNDHRKKLQSLESVSRIETF